MLDEIDRRILWRLDLDARMQLTKLAAEVGLSKQALNHRLHKLHDEGYILGHIAIIDIHRLGLLTYRLYFRFAAAGPSKAKRLIEQLCAHRNTLFVGTLRGAWDAEVVFTVRNFIHFNEVLKEVIAPYGSTIYRSNISMTPKVYLFRRDYLLQAEREFDPLLTYGYEPVPGSWDDLDFGILNILASDGRISHDELGKRLGVSNNTVRARVARLEAAKIIRGYRTLLSVERLGREYVKALLELAPMTKKQERTLYTSCARHTAVVYLTEVLGTWQLEIEAEVEKLSDIDDLVRKLRYEHPSLILDYQIVSVTEQAKLNYLPAGAITRNILVPQETEPS